MYKVLTTTLDNWESSASALCRIITVDFQPFACWGAYQDAEP